MKFCTKCKTDRPETDFYVTQAGKMLRPCKFCKQARVRASRKQKPKETIKTVYSVSYTQMRHPDSMVHEGNVQKEMKRVADEIAKINDADLTTEAEAGRCDKVLKETT